MIVCSDYEIETLTYLTRKIIRVVVLYAPEWIQVSKNITPHEEPRQTGAQLVDILSRVYKITIDDISRPMNARGEHEEGV